ncbi:MAG: hypothetical protein IJ391_06755 [Clostridia bacterium]|nr:hypothetical protein [Clostridia bacterium]
MESDNGWDWHTKADMINNLDEDHLKVGFQYIDFIIEGEDILFQCRTAMNNAKNYHDTNYSTFHIIKNFRTEPELI